MIQRLNDAGGARAGDHRSSRWLQPELPELWIVFQGFYDRMYMNMHK